MALTLMALLVGSSPAIARAQHGGWSDLLVPGRRDAADEIRDGLGFLVSAIGSPQRDGIADAPEVQLDSALLRFARARPFFEDDANLAYYTAVALTRWHRPAREGGEERRVDEALAAWARLREIEASYLPAVVAAEMAALYTRSGDFERSTAEYEAALQLSRPTGAWFMRHPFDPRGGYRVMMSEWVLASLYVPPNEARVHGNLAENRMLLGQLDQALVHYRAALLGSRSAFSRALYRWGLALAHTRNGDHDAALLAARAAVEADPIAADGRYRRLQGTYGSFAVLHHPDVFFEPGYEIHAYHAMGYEAYAEMPDHDGSRRRVLEHALQSWRRFLVEGGTSSRWAEGVRRSVERLEAEIAELPEDPPSPALAQRLPGGTRPADDMPPWRRLWTMRVGAWLPL